MVRVPRGGTSQEGFQLPQPQVLVLGQPDQEGSTFPILYVQIVRGDTEARAGWVQVSATDVACLAILPRNAQS